MAAAKSREGAMKPTRILAIVLTMAASLATVRPAEAGVSPMSPILQCGLAAPFPRGATIYRPDCAAIAEAVWACCSGER
jgi:hypothetical protein